MFVQVNFSDFLNTIFSLICAFFFGGLVGFERQIRQRTAGLRTNTLVSVGAAIFVDMSLHLAGVEGAARVISYVVSGVGFLGAGVIMLEGGNVRGINTAATLWGSAAVGTCCGAHLYLHAALGALFVVAANTLLRPIASAINRKPINTNITEVTYMMYAIARRDRQKNARERLRYILETGHYPVRDITAHPFGKEEVELEAVLLPTLVDVVELDQLVDRLLEEPFFTQAFWISSTTD